MMHANQNNKIKIAMKGLENIWLREWRVLFMANPIENLDMVDEIYQMMDKLISDYKSSSEMSRRCRWFLRKVSIDAGFLTRKEIARASFLLSTFSFLLSEHEKLAIIIIRYIYRKLPDIKKLKNAKRKTLILIVDEHMDYIAFEAMKIVNHHPVTQFPSLHVAYALFKQVIKEKTWD